jgi:hypothetical protein
MLTAIDTETELISDETKLPPLICFSLASLSNVVDLFPRQDASDVFEAIADTGDHIVAHNAAFDLGVLGRHAPALMPRIFSLLSDGRIHDTAIREMLHEIKRGTLTMSTRQKGHFKLERVAKRRLNRDLVKGEDSYQSRFGELRDVPIDQWPAEARTYATVDAATCRDLCIAQKKDGPFPDESLQCQAAFSLRLMSEHGMMTHEPSIDAFEASLLEASIGELEILEGAGIIRTTGPKRQLGTTDLKLLHRYIEDAYCALGMSAPRTDPTGKFPDGQVKTDEETLADIADDPRLPDATRLVLKARVRFSKIGKLLNTYVPALRKGVILPIHADLRVLVESGRTSCAEPNLQNLPRKPGARECFRARRGCVYLSVDYSTAELRALAQMCYHWFGFSALRDAFCARPPWAPGGIDPHLVLAANLLSISVEDAHRHKDDPEVDETRQVSKVGNFGFAGGLGAETFITYARNMGVRGLLLSRAKEIKAAWRGTWPEMGSYFNMIAQITSELGPKRIEQYRSGRIRGGVTFTEACNGYFQALVADFAKAALYEVTRRCYTVESSALYGARPCLFVHDEIILEVEEEQAHDAAIECEEVMREIQSQWLPDVPPATDAHLMRHWSKKAKRVLDARGRLIPWEDRDGRMAA